MSVETVETAETKDLGHAQYDVIKPQITERQRLAAHLVLRDLVEDSGQEGVRRRNGNVMHYAPVFMRICDLALERLAEILTDSQYVTRPQPVKVPEPTRSVIRLGQRLDREV